MSDKTTADVELLAWQVGARPAFLRRDTIREWLIEQRMTPGIMQKLATVMAEIEPDDATIDMVSAMLDQDKR